VNFRRSDPIFVRGGTDRPIGGRVKEPLTKVHPNLTVLEINNLYVIACDLFLSCAPIYNLFLDSLEQVHVYVHVKDIFNAKFFDLICTCIRLWVMYMLQTRAELPLAWGRGAPVPNFLFKILFTFAPKQNVIVLPLATN
jgi:hypothetical protein